MCSKNDNLLWLGSYQNLAVEVHDAGTNEEFLKAFESRAWPNRWCGIHEMLAIECH